MNAWWGLLIFVGCKILHTCHGTCNDRVNIVFVQVGDRMSVPCPNSSAEDVAFRLFKDGEMIDQYRWSRVGGTPTGNLTTNSVGVEYENVQNNSFRFTLTGVNASRHGIYRCEGTVTFPPPLIELSSDLSVLLLTEGHQNRKEKEKNVYVQTCRSDWMLVFVLVVGLYSVTVTIVAIIFWVKSRKEDSEPAYINTNPKTRNKKRLNNPTPRFICAPH